ncbi:RNA-directed DNA polymerase, eukaryota, reverse transcriptase zinc-binding domain protein [Tanacetum coccineum]
MGFNLVNVEGVESKVMRECCFVVEKDAWLRDLIGEFTLSSLDVLQRFSFFLQMGFTLILATLDGLDVGLLGDVIGKDNCDDDGALDTHKLIPRRSPWQDVILAIHSLQSKGINLMDFIQKKVGNGENTSFWDDSWLGEVALKVLYKRLYALEMCKSISVAEKMGHPSLSHYFRRMPRGGVEQENYGLLCSKVADLVLPNISDRWCWSLEGSQEFSVKSSRILIDNTILPKAEVPTRWLRVVPIKVNVHAWRVCLDKLPTRANLSLRGMDIPSIACPLCNSAVESTSIFFSLVPWLAKFGENF